MWLNLRQSCFMGFSVAKRKEAKSNEKAGKERSKSEHEEERDGAVLQASRKHPELLRTALARVCEVGHEEPKEAHPDAERNRFRIWPECPELGIGRGNRILP